MKAAIFDVDGTLLDSMGVWYDITEDYFKRHGAAITKEQGDAFQEMTLEESLPIIKSMLSISDSIEAMMEEFKQLVAYEYAYKLPLKPYAAEYLKKLHSEGVKLAIATSGYLQLCEAAFKRLGIWEYFQAAALSSEVGVNKSNPDVYLLAAERLGVAPGGCMVFEDILSGINGAKRAGMRTTAVYDPTNEQFTAALKQASDHYITGWKDLL